MKKLLMLELELEGSQEAVDAAEDAVDTLLDDGVIQKVVREAVLALERDVSAPTIVNAMCWQTDDRAALPARLARPALAPPPVVQAPLDQRLSNLELVVLGVRARLRQVPVRAIGLLATPDTVDTDEVAREVARQAAMLRQSAGAPSDSEDDEAADLDATEAE